METIIYTEDSLAVPARLIRQGELIAFPTETVYGLGADATNEAAVNKVYQAKGRPSDNPLIVHLKEITDLDPFVDNLSEKAQSLMAKFWPGPLTLIFEIKKNSLPSVATGGLSTAAFRMPNNKMALALIEQAGVPIVGPSANTSGKPSPTTAQHVYHDLAGKIAGILDDGPTDIGLESTVVDMTAEIPVILRPGAVTVEALARVVGEVKLDQHLISENEAPKAPGMKYQHYSPDARVLLIDWQKNNWQEAVDWSVKKGISCGILASREIIQSLKADVVGNYELSLTQDVQTASQWLFAGLRELDEQQPPIAVIFAQTYPEEGAGLAYMNRLKKAANQEYFQSDD